MIYRGLVTGTPATTVTWTELPAYAPTTWTVPGTTTAATTAFGDTGANDVTFTDTGSTPNATTSATLPVTDTAVEGPYDQNVNLVNAFAATGIKAFGSDASKPYPNPATQPFAPESAGTTYAGATTPAGASFTDGGAQAVPRYPTNIYYNVSTAAQEVSEYNYVYLPPPAGVCVNSSTNTCLTTGVTDVSQIYASVDQNMFSHLMGNDPRPHYFHQSNLIGGSGTGLFYGTMTPLLSEYNTYFNAPIAPIAQPTMVADRLDPGRAVGLVHQHDGQRLHPGQSGDDHQQQLRHQRADERNPRCRLDLRRHAVRLDRVVLGNEQLHRADHLAGREDDERAAHAERDRRERNLDQHGEGDRDERRQLPDHGRHCRADLQ